MASPLLCNASCYGERIATSNATNADFLKQPLIVIQDLESSQSSFSSSSSQEGKQNADIARQQRVRILILVKSFCFGTFASLLLHAVLTISAFWVMYNNNKWRKNTTQPDESAAPLLSIWNLYFLLTILIAFHTLVWVGFVMTQTRKGSTYMLKKFDNDDAHHAPKSAESSVWTPLFLVVNGAIFLIGISSGLRVALTILNIALGMSIPLPLGPLLVSCCLMGLIKCYDRDDDDDELWTADDDEPEEDQEEDSSFVV